MNPVAVSLPILCNALLGELKTSQSSTNKFKQRTQYTLRAKRSISIFKVVATSNYKTKRFQLRNTGPLIEHHITFLDFHKKRPSLAKISYQIYLVF